jgi:hypothetical protein
MFGRVTEIVYNCMPRTHASIVYIKCHLDIALDVGLETGDRTQALGERTRKNRLVVDGK